MKLIESKRFLL